MTTRRKASSVRARKRTRKRKAAPPLDPVTRYAQRVLAGDIVAGRAVRLACQRHLHDLERQRTEAFPYFWDGDAAEKLIAFFPTFLTLESGDPFTLPEWLQFSFGSMFGWKRTSDKKRKYQVGYFETGKGSAKTPGGGGVGLYCLAFEDEPFGEVYSAAFDKGQALIMLNDAIRMALSSPDLSEILDIGAYNIAHPESGSFFRAVSSEHRSKSGPRPSVVLVDELHEHRSPTVVNKLRAGFKFRSQPLQLEFTNSGHDRTSICWDHHQKSLAVLEGTEPDEQWFAYVCQLDPCEKCYGEGHRQPQEGCPDCDDWTDPAVWPKANPALGIVIQPKYLADQVAIALSIPSDRALIKRLNFCLWTETHQVWIAPDAWEACKVPTVGDNLEGARAAGFDMSEKLDLTACVVGIKTPAPDEPVETVDITEIEGDQEIKHTFELNFYVDLVPFFWLPETTLRQRVTKERIPFDVWARAGFLRVTPGPVIDYDLIFDQFKKEIGPTYKPGRIGYDPHNATQFALQLRDKLKYTVVEVKQGRALSESFKLFEALVMLRRIRHAGNPVMGWCVSNAEPKRDRYENAWAEKASPLKRIDGLIAAVMCLSQLMVMPMTTKPKRRGVAKIWRPGVGFVPAVPEESAHA